MANDTPRRHPPVTRTRPDDPAGAPAPGVFVIGQRVTQGGAGPVMRIREMLPDGRIWCEWQGSHGRLGGSFEARELKHVT